MEIRRFKYVAGVVTPPEEAERGLKRIKGTSRDFDNAEENSCLEEEKRCAKVSGEQTAPDLESSGDRPKFGFASVCGRRRDMEDALAVHPSFLRRQNGAATDLHYYGVYDGHGCSHVRPVFIP